jgi:hydrogenase maturation protease
VSRAIVVGYGNTLRSDDGAGWHAAALLAEDPRLAGAAVLARHQLTPELALDFSEASLVVLVDADAAGRPGELTVRQLQPDGTDHAGDAPAGAGGTGGVPGPSSHHVGPAELLALARELYGAAPPAFLVSVGAADMGPGEDLSPAVRAALPGLVDTVAVLIDAHGRDEAATG